MSDEQWIDDFRALNDPTRRRELERRGDFFVVEGLFALEALVASPYPLRSLLVAENKVDVVHAMVAAVPGVDEVPMVVRPAAELVAITGFAFHRGVLATARRLPLPPVDEVAAGARRLLVVEGVGSGSRAWAPWITALVWVEAAPEIRLARGLARDGEEVREHWLAWTEDEQRLFAREETRERADLVVAT